MWNDDNEPKNERLGKRIFDDMYEVVHCCPSRVYLCIWVFKGLIVLLLLDEMQSTIFSTVSPIHHFSFVLSLSLSFSHTLSLHVVVFFSTNFAVVVVNFRFFTIVNGIHSVLRSLNECRKFTKATDIIDTNTICHSLSLSHSMYTRW